MIQDIGPKRLINHYDPERRPAPDDRIFWFSHGSVMTQASAEKQIDYPRFRDVDPDGRYIYLFSIDGTGYFLAPDGIRFQSVSPVRDLSADLSDPDDGQGFILADVRRLRRDGFGPQSEIFAAYTALQLANWYRDNRFCGTCGHRTKLGKTERSLICPSCGRTIYPRVIPAVIVGVRDGNRLLETKYVRSRGVPFYALVAGFTEIGETLEQTVEREVMEEVGLRVKNITYYKSQPWGIVDDILAGFYCDVDGDSAITLDRSELREAVWMERDEVVTQPDNFSLTNEMMEVFKAGKDPQ